MSKSTREVENLQHNPEALLTIYRRLLTSVRRVFLRGTWRVPERSAFLFTQRVRSEVWLQTCKDVSYVALYASLGRSLGRMAFPFG